MPVVAHRQPRLGSAACRNSYSSYSSNGSGRDSQLWIVQENGDHHRQKTMDFPAPRRAPLPSGQKPKSQLRVDTYSKPDLHDRYLSSEEEVSPSPHESFDNVGRQGSAGHAGVDGTRDITDIKPLEADVMMGIAIVVTIMNAGKPKVIDIPRLAPMQKRRSSDLTGPSLHHRQGSLTSCYSTKSATSSRAALSINDDAVTQAAGGAPSSPEAESPDMPTFNLPILPEADLAIAHEAAMLAFPGLDIRPTPSYRDYDPYLLDPPRLHQRSRLRTNPGSGFVWKGGLSRHGDGRVPRKTTKLLRRASGRAASIRQSPSSPFQDGESARRMVVA
ncbi:hypothetical protein MMC16_003124 [Acarospora aff. strigata]|nr:hypothetical protein [Acarospora aff. strigata]